MVWLRVNPLYAGEGGEGRAGCTELGEVISLVSSVVIESGDSIVLDLGQDTETEPPTPRSQDSASSLLSKVIKVSSIILHIPVLLILLHRNARPPR